MTSLAKHIRDLTTVLENIELEADFDQEILELLEDIDLEESTLMQIAGSDPAGRNLAKYLHRFHKFGDRAELTPWPLKSQPDWNMFKEYADNVLIIQAENGWAFYKPVSETQRQQDYGLKTQAKRGQIANNLQDSEFYIAFNNGKIMTDAEIDAEIEKLDRDRTRTRGMPSAVSRRSDQFYRQGTRRGGKSATAFDKRGINMFDTVKELVGPKILNVWMARQREDLTKFQQTRQQILDKIVADLGLDPDPSTWTISEKQLVRKALDRSGVSLGSGRIGKQVFGPGASVEPTKIGQRRPTEVMNDQERLTYRLHRLAPEIFRQVRVMLKRKQADERSMSRLKDYMDRAIASADEWTWKRSVERAIDSAATRRNLSSEDLIRDAGHDPQIMQELIKNIRDYLVDLI